MMLLLTLQAGTGTITLTTGEIILNQDLTITAPQNFSSSPTPTDRFRPCSVRGVLNRRLV